MKSDITRFAGEFEAPELFISPVHDADLNTLQGSSMASDYFVRAALRATLDTGLESTELALNDLKSKVTPDADWLLDRFVDATGGVDPGRPTIQLIDSTATISEILQTDPDEVRRRLDMFYRQTGVKPRPRLRSGSTKKADESSWGGDMNKLSANIRLPRNGASMKSLLHELGHAGVHLIGLVVRDETTIDGTKHSTKRNLRAVSGGLKYEIDGQQGRGDIVDEAVAEGIGALANRKLGLVPTRYYGGKQRLPDMVAPYITADSFSWSAPAAIAFELIAKELGIPSDDYFRRFVDYANAGVADPSARAEVAETIYKGTRGKLTLGQLEVLPYPLTAEAGLAPLWAVEDALEIPEAHQYSRVFSDAYNRSA